MAIRFRPNFDNISPFADESDESVSSFDGDDNEFVMMRNTTPKGDWISLDQTHYDDSITGQRDRLLSIGDTVEIGKELLGTSGERQGDFLRIKAIFMDLDHGEIKLRGHRFCRNSYLEGLLPKKLNEVYLMLRIDYDDERDNMIQGMHEVSLREVVRKRRLIITNEKYPTYSFRGDTVFYSNMENAEENRANIANSHVLVCRWIEKQFFINERGREIGDYIERSLERVTWDIADHTYRRKDLDFFTEWRGGLMNSTASGEITFGDAFCGGGGVSSGAKMAGCKVCWGLDCDRAACTTYQQNHCEGTTAECYNDDVQNLNTFNDIELRVHVVHASPPCPAFSWANYDGGRRDHNTVAGQRDENNQAAMFMIEHLLKKTRARVCTVEQTDGLVRIGRHNEFFVGLISQFTFLGWSIRWKIMNFAQYGLPGARKRLIIIASCPGGVLPKFPLPTNGPDLPNDYRTIHDAISHLDPKVHTLHNPNDPNLRCNKEPYSEHTLLRHLITTTGTLDCHPSGRRNFTLRELACLQGFPDDYVFHQRQNVRGEIIRQIGNSVPPIFVEKLMKAIKESLEWEDVKRIADAADEAEAAAASSRHVRRDA